MFDYFIIITALEGTISPIYRRKIFYDISTQQRRSVKRWKFSEQNFENFATRGRFKKRQNFSQNFQVLRIQAVITPHNLAMITNRRKFNSKFSTCHLVGCRHAVDWS